MNRNQKALWRIIGVISSLVIVLLVIVFAIVNNFKIDNVNSRVTVENITSFNPAVERVKNSVVNIFTSKANHKNNKFFENFFGGPNREPNNQSLGSGVVFENGYIITNYHVIEGASSIVVAFQDGSKIDATVVGFDKETDIAILKTEAELTRQPIAMADSNKIKVGDIVLAIGNPFGVGQSVSMGIISALGRKDVGINVFENFIQTDAAINPGNSGGALVNHNGELVGVNTAIFSRSGGNQGIGFSIPINLVKRVFKSILADGKVVRGWLGIIVSHNTASDKVRITSISPDSPAEIAGLYVGDVITKIQDTRIQEVNEVINAIVSSPPGSSLKLEVIRDDKPIVITAVLQERKKLK